MKGLPGISATLVVLVVVTTAMAKGPADPTGTWQWKLGNQSAVHTLKLKLEGDKLSGTIQSYQNARESPIEEAAYKDGNVTFKHAYKNRAGQISIASYTGTVSGDTIEGKIEFKHPEQMISSVWYATRTK